MEDTLAKLTTVFHAVFNDDDIVLTRATTAANLADWDSVNHITLMKSVERAFGIKVSGGEAVGLKNVGELVDLIDRKKK